MEAYVKHFQDGTVAAKADAETNSGKPKQGKKTTNPYTGPQFAGHRGQAKNKAWNKGYDSVKVS